jgi:hypothetical protein
VQGTGRDQAAAEKSDGAGEKDAARRMDLRYNQGLIEGSSMKSYWMPVNVRTVSAKRAVLSWFDGLCRDMTVESAEVLCDKQTDREKKLKAVVVDAQGNRRLATRTFGKTYTMSLVHL